MFIEKQAPSFIPRRWSGLEDKEGSNKAAVNIKAEAPCLDFRRERKKVCSGSHQ